MKHIKEDRKGQIVSGVKIEDRVISETGASRSVQTGKGRYDLIPPCAMRRLALRYEGGAVAHGDRNWEQGMSAGRCYGSAMRHLNQWAEGKTDEDHLGAAMWNVAALMFAEEHRPEHLDMPAFEERRKLAMSEIKPGKPRISLSEAWDKGVKEMKKAKTVKKGDVIPGLSKILKQEESMRKSALSSKAMICSKK